MLDSRVPGRTDFDALLFAVDARVGERFTVVFLAGGRFTVVFLTGAFFAGGIPYSVLDYTESKEKKLSLLTKPLGELFDSHTLHRRQCCLGRRVDVVRRGLVQPQPRGHEPQRRTGLLLDLLHKYL